MSTFTFSIFMLPISVSLHIHQAATSPTRCRPTGPPQSSLSGRSASWISASLVMSKVSECLAGPCPRSHVRFRAEISFSNAAVMACPLATCRCSASLAYEYAEACPPYFSKAPTFSTLAGVSLSSAPTFSASRSQVLSLLSRLAFESFVYFSCRYLSTAFTKLSTLSPPSKAFCMFPLVHNLRMVPSLFNPSASKVSFSTIWCLSLNIASSSLTS